MGAGIVALKQELENIFLIQEISRIHVIPDNIRRRLNPGSPVKSIPGTGVPVICAVSCGLPGRNTAVGHQITGNNAFIFNSRIPVYACMLGGKYPVRVLAVKLP